MENKKKKTTLLQLHVGMPKRIIFSFLIMAVLIIFVYFCKIPNPNMILIAGLVLCSALFGFGGGITAGVIMFFYTLFFFSTDNSFIYFTPQNMQKVVVSLAGILVDMLLVCFLKRAEMNQFKQINELTEQLHKENERLQTISLTDALTGIQNRMALRQGYDSYKDREVTVMMLDIDKFKMINDKYGHKEGDKALHETGVLLAATFGKENCYRYGGDEFLIILAGETEEEFNKKLGAMMQKKPVIKEEDGTVINVDYSVGCVHGVFDEEHSLRSLFAEADERMYKIKRGKSEDAAKASDGAIIR